MTGYDRPDWIDYSQSPSDRKTEGLTVQRLARLSGDKPQFAFIETSDANLSWTPPGTPGVTPAQFRGEIWDAIIHGAQGIFYFPQSFNPFQYDATPANVVAEMTTQDALIDSMAPILNSAASYPDPALQLSFSSQLLEGTSRTLNGEHYDFVLNMSRRALIGQTVEMPGLPAGRAVNVLNESRSLVTQSNAVTDNFAPYQLHIYNIGPASSQPMQPAQPTQPTGSTTSSGSTRHRHRRAH